MTTNSDRNKTVEWEVSFQVDERTYVSDKSLLLAQDYVRIDPLPVKGETPPEKIREILRRIPLHRFGLEKIKLAYPGGDYSGPDDLIIKRRHIKLLRNTAFRNKLQFGFCGNEHPVILYDGDVIIGALYPMRRMPFDLFKKIAESVFFPDMQEVEQETKEAEAALLIFAEKGCLSARMALCELYVNQVGPRALKALEWYRDAAEKGLPSAQHVMGIYYSPDGGRGVVEANGKQMVDWFLKAAKGGNSSSIAALAFAFERGEDGEINLVKAFAIFDLMLARGNKDAVNRNRCMQQMPQEEIEMAYKLSCEYAEQFPAKPMITERDLCDCHPDACHPVWPCS